MDGAWFLLSITRNPFGDRIKELRLDENLRLMPLRGYVLTSHGPEIISGDAGESFGGDKRTQVIGTTICALAHECESLTATRLFCRFLMPYLFEVPHHIAEAIQEQLIEKQNLQRILNEGSSRGLNNLFIDTLAVCNLPLANQGWRQTKLGQEDEEYGYLGEVNMVGGLLRWIAQDKPEEYRTRSGYVARVAVCLKAIGYHLGHIQIWNGLGESPYPRNRKSLTLVLGGSSATDMFMESFPQLPDAPLLLHYQFKTTGAMLLTALQNAPDIRPETLQEYFENIFAYLEDHLSIEFTDGEGGPGTVCHWKKPKKAPTPTQVRLASILFPENAESIAPCYSKSSDTLESVAGKSKGIIEPRNLGLARFRAISACVVISIISRFAPSSFHCVHHATTMDLSMPHWLENVAGKLDAKLSGDGRFHTSSIVSLLALVHAGDDAEDFQEMHSTNRSNVAFRKGIYGIIPSFLLNMEISRDGFEYVCIDYFWANVKVPEHGYIRSASTPDVERFEIDVEQPCANTNLSSLQRLNEPNLGPPNQSTPDQPLKMSLGSSLHTGEPDLCFVAWIGGFAAGTVGIVDVQRAILLSRVEPETCPGHSNPAQFVNVKASLWAQDPYSKPTHSHHPMFLPLQGDHCWTIFVAGQTVFQNGRIVFQCVDCAMEKFVNAETISSGSVGPKLFVGFA